MRKINNYLNKKNFSIRKFIGIISRFWFVLSFFMTLICIILILFFIVFMPNQNINIIYKILFASILKILYSLISWGLTKVKFKHFLNTMFNFIINEKLK